MPPPPRLMPPCGRQELEVPGPVMWAYLILGRAPGKDKGAGRVARGLSTSQESQKGERHLCHNLESLMLIYSPVHSF